MKISEIFRSVQGEGINIGVPSTFVRVAGCNLSCRWCDTVYAGADATDYRNCTVAQVLDEALRLRTEHVVITGGEPLLYPDEIKELCGMLRDQNKFITIETNATILTEGIKADLISLSPKPPSSGEKDAVKINVIRRFLESYRCQLKFVIDDDKDLKASTELLSRLSKYEFDGPVLQPVCTEESQARYRERLADLIQKTSIDENSYSEFFRGYASFRVLPQFHRIAFGSKKSV